METSETKTGAGKWRVICEDGKTHEVAVTHCDQGTPWRADFPPAGGSAVGQTPRGAVMVIVRLAQWKPVEILAPGEKARGEMTDELARSEDEARRALDELHRRVEAAERERDEAHALVEKQSAILTATANALKGDPAPLAMHSHHDLAEVAAALRTEVAAAGDFIDRQSRLILATADALKGPPAPGSVQSGHDLPEVAARLRAELDAAEAEVARLGSEPPPRRRRPSSCGGCGGPWGNWPERCDRCGYPGQ